MSKKYIGGFTLIELLVVIAIIGLLSSVVLASLNSARNKGGDAAVASNLGNIRAQAAIYYDDNGNNYGDIGDDCSSGLFSDPVVQNMIAAAESAGGGTAVCTGDDTDSTNYAIITRLKSAVAGQTCADAASNCWCIDYTGAARKSTGITAGVCN